MRMACRQGLGERGENSIGVAVDFVAAGVGELGCERQAGRLQAIDQRLFDRLVCKYEPARDLFGLDVLEVRQEPEMASQGGGAEVPLEALLGSSGAMRASSGWVSSANDGGQGTRRWRAASHLTVSSSRSASVFVPSSTRFA